MEEEENMKAEKEREVRKRKNENEGRERKNVCREIKKMKEEIERE